MIDLLLPAVLLVGIATLAVAVLTFRSSRRSEELGEDRYELVRDQQNRLDLLREERQVLVDELMRESQERQRFMEGNRPHAAEEWQQERRRVEQELRRLEEQLEQERQAREEGVREAVREAEQQEQERRRLEEERRRLEEQLGLEREERTLSQQETEQLAEQLQHLREGLRREQEERLQTQRWAEQQEQERQRLQQELERSTKEAGSVARVPAPPRSRQPGSGSPRLRRPIVVVGLLLGALGAWLVSLIVALGMLSP
jgi:hypothetical protein